MRWNKPYFRNVIAICCLFAMQSFASEDLKNFKISNAPNNSHLNELLDHSEDSIKKELHEMIVSLGWENDFKNVNYDLIEFEKAHPEFRPYVLLSLSTNLGKQMSQLSEYKDNESSTNIIGALGTILLLPVKGLYHGGKFVLSLFINSVGFASLTVFAPHVAVIYLAYVVLIKIPLAIIMSALSVVAHTFIGVVKGVHYLGKSLIHYSFWGSQIPLEDRIKKKSFNNATASIYCKHKSKSKYDFWLKENSELSGSWGMEAKDIAFATQVKPLSLLSQCAHEMRKKFKIQKLKPDEVIPAVGVSVAGSSALYSDYRIVYYSDFTDRKDKAIKLTTYFSH